MQPRVENIGQYLREYDIKPSFQRIKVYEYLYQNYSHPTVDDIYKELVPEIPTLSKTTVYNTLKLFIDKGIVQMISIEENETRYDANVSLHGHFKCEKCGKVMDFAADINQLESDDLQGCQINQRHLFFKGICKDCQ